MNIHSLKKSSMVRHRIGIVRLGSSHSVSIIEFKAVLVKQEQSLMLFLRRTKQLSPKECNSPWT